jgi:hypothetical protein
MIYRRLSLRSMIWLLAHPLPPSPFSKSLRHQSTLLTGDGIEWGGGGGAKKCDGKKPLSSVKHSILSEPDSKESG